MSKDKTWRELLQKVVADAKPHAQSLRKYAGTIGVSYNELQAFLSKGHASVEPFRKIEFYAIENRLVDISLRPSDAMPLVAKSPDAAWIVGYEMIGMGLWLQSDISIDEKIERYQVWLAEARRNLAQIIAQQQKSGE